jgi:hypothetical protein
MMIIINLEISYMFGLKYIFCFCFRNHPDLRIMYILNTHYEDICCSKYQFNYFV